jgi:glycosyltransferase involved in cell wall biosynthesis
MISIITVARNAAETIPDCLASVAGQSVRPEHVIVDGASTDGTLEIVGGWTGHPVRVFSGPDQGMYDAMNKGVDRVSGDIIGILNADDVYADGEVLARVREAFEDGSVEACYGDLLYVKEEGRSKKAEKGQPSSRPSSQQRISNSASPPHRPTVPPSHRITRYWRAGEGSARLFYWGWMPPHPTFFTRRTVYERYGGFRLDMGSAADYEFMLRVLVKHGVKAVYLPSVLVRMRVGGVSNVTVGNRVRANRMDREAWRVNGLRPYPWTLWMKPLRKVSQWWKGRSKKAEVGTGKEEGRSWETGKRKVESWKREIWGTDHFSFHLSDFLLLPSSFLLLTSLGWAFKEDPNRFDLAGLSVWVFLFRDPSKVNVWGHIFTVDNWNWG